MYNLMYKHRDGKSKLISNVVLFSKCRLPFLIEPMNVGTLHMVIITAITNNMLLFNAQLPQADDAVEGKELMYDKSIKLK